MSNFVQLDTERGFVRVDVTATLLKGKLLRWMIMKFKDNSAEEFGEDFDDNTSEDNEENIERIWTKSVE